MAASTTTTQPIERTLRAATVADQGVAGVADPAPPGTGYRLGRLLGRGGEGQVLEAVQEAFGRTVAVKILRGEEPGPRQLRRFRAEAAITALLEHPAIIPVHDLRLDSQGRPQLIMKRVSGRTWRDLLDGLPGPHKRPLTGEEHLDVLLKVCDAVAFAHSRGILHRDLKPENVMVGEHGEVLVMDWGCAVHIGPLTPHPDIPVLGELHGVSGTPAYLSPEQARADHVSCGPWSDVYLLGAVLFRMLTGLTPWRGADVASTIALAARGDPPPDPIATGAKVPPELARIAMEAMQPDPARRTRSADDFAAAVRRYLEHREVHRLLAEAGRQHGLARAGGPETDNAYRRAISAAEQALSLWPDHMGARRVLVEIGLDSARHAIATGAFRVARRQAQTVGAEAERLADHPAVDTAQKLVGLADLRERQQRGREAKLAATRKLALGGAVVAALALLVGLLAVWRESANTGRALAAARDNLERAEAERAARVEGERLATPALLAQARELTALRRLPDALALVRLAGGFSPEDAAPMLMEAQLLAALGRRPEAAAALTRLLARRPDRLAEELRELCAQPPPDADLRVADVLVRMGAGSLAAALNLATGQRAELARRQLIAAWPQLPAASIDGLPDGTLAISLRRDQLPLDGLEPLRGLPITRLDLTGQDRVRDLAPLATLPLTWLDADGVGAGNFAPVLGLRLKRLRLGGTIFTDLTALRGQQFEALAVPIPGVASLAPISALPLRQLWLSEADTLRDITALNLLPLEELAIDAPTAGGAALTDLGPLRGRRLRELSLTNQRGVRDLSPLRGMPLGTVVLDGTTVTDLAPILGPSLTHLSLIDAAVDDLRPLASTRLETLRVTPARIRHGLDELARIPGLRAINGLAPADFLAWSALQRAIAAVDPGYLWNASAVFDNGRPVELRFADGLRSLDPLRGLPLRHLVAPRGTFTDLRPLAGMPLVHLDLSGSAVRDLGPLSGQGSLRILHLAGTRIVDVAPLAPLRLETLTLPAARITAGTEHLRAMRSLMQAGDHPDRLLPIREFWTAFDRGDLR